MRNGQNIDFTCDTEDCIHWEDGVCKYPASITIQEHCCVDYETGDVKPAVLRTHKFATPERMEEITNNALDSFGELLNGSSLYDALSGSLKMSDTEILAAGFVTLKPYMEGGD